jgi:fructose-1,6-bisphosphatase II
MDRELTLELVRVTEAGALAAAPLVGRGDGEAVDAAAVEAMRAVLHTIDFEGVVTIGEGEMDEAPMLYIGERVGTGRGEQVDVAVDPVEGTTLVAKGLPGAIATVAVAPRGSLLHAPDMYMDKIAVGPQAAGHVSLDATPEENVLAVARALGKRPEEVTVVMLDRPRHAHLVEAVRRAGARIRLISAGDVGPAIATAFEGSGLDMLLGSGGAPEGVLAAAALHSLGGDLQGRLMPADAEEEARAAGMLGGDPRRLLRLSDLVGTGDVIFAATGITSGDLLRGVRFTGRAAHTHSLATRASTGTLRFVEAIHLVDRKLRRPVL